jgi:hypothetical protein
LGSVIFFLHFLALLIAFGLRSDHPTFRLFRGGFARMPLAFSGHQIGTIGGRLAVLGAPATVPHAASRAA